MNKKILSILLCIAILVSIGPKPKAVADAMTASMLGSIAYAVMQSSGISFTSAAATGAGMETFMGNQITDYVNSNGGSIASLFGNELARLEAGKLLLGQNIYNGISNFIGWLRDKFTGNTLDGGDYNGQELDVIADGATTEAEILQSGYGAYFYGYNTSHGTYAYCYTTVDGQKRGYHSAGSGAGYTGKYRITYDGSSNKLVYTLEYKLWSTGATRWMPGGDYTISGTVNQLNWSVPDNYQAPQPLPQDKQWEGDFSGTPGWAEPQDLPDFLSRIPVGIADNNLVVVGQVTQATGPSPSPSPSPSPGQSPSYNTGKIAIILAEILNLIKNLTGDTATDPDPSVIDQTAQEIAGQAQTVPDAITQSGTQTQTAIQEQTQTITETATQTKEAIEEATQTITETATQTKEAIEEATDVPEQSKWDEVKKDLHGVFPFCIPWDIYAMLNVFNASPKTPKFEIPFNIPSIGLEYTFDFDFQEFDQVAETLRTVELIAFCVGLAILTSKVIRW